MCGDGNGEISGIKYVMDISGSHLGRNDLDLGSVSIISGTMVHTIQSGSGVSTSVCNVIYY